MPLERFTLERYLPVALDDKRYTVIISIKGYELAKIEYDKKKKHWDLFESVGGDGGYDYLHYSKHRTKEVAIKAASDLS